MRVDPLDVPPPGRSRIAAFAGPAVTLLVLTAGEWILREGEDLGRWDLSLVAVLFYSAYSTVVAVTTAGVGPVPGAISAGIATAYAAHGIATPGCPFHALLASDPALAVVAATGPSAALLAGLLWPKGGRRARRPADGPLPVRRDPVTGAFSPGAIRALAQLEFDRANDWSLPLSIVLLQVEVPDGDREDLLGTVAGFLVRSLRSADFVGRYDGDSFAAVLPGTRIEGATTAAQGVVQVVSRVPAGGGRMTATAGVAAAREGDASAEDVFARAETSLAAAASRRIPILPPPKARNPAAGNGG